MVCIYVIISIVNSKLYFLVALQFCWQQMFVYVCETLVSSIQVYSCCYKMSLFVDVVIGELGIHVLSPSPVITVHFSC